MMITGFVVADFCHAFTASQNAAALFSSNKGFDFWVIFDNGFLVFPHGALRNWSSLAGFGIFFAGVVAGVQNDKKRKYFLIIP
ncbi:hypothetical protein HSX37_04945|uniref:hypothetical protein n=1 Tax=Dendrosporobacter quercicolus TaxID=146817 RepID=UPI0011140066|nr:hypothetical protein [Dendrosporobacter quercicolus]NSL47390.1 hypothetical protein [Dendrosporobacter quercicolus DSM 1736]